MEKSMSKYLPRRKFISWSLRGLAAAVVGKGYYNTTPGELTLSRVDIRLPGLPAAFHGARIAHFTDLHASWIVDADLYRRAVALAMQERPDWVVLTGDFITGATKFLSDSVGSFDRQYLDNSIAALAGLQAPLGIYGVLGNHDFWSGPAAVAAITQAYSEALGVRWLRNSHVRLEKNGAAIELLGVDDYWETSSSLYDACKGLDEQSVRILLSHNPDINEEIDVLGKRIDLVLSGHTHGGQVVLPLAGQPVMPSKFGQKYRAGLVQDGARQTYVSRGIGHLLFPMRFNCPPEVAIIRLS